MAFGIGGTTAKTVPGGQWSTSGFGGQTTGAKKTYSGGGLQVTRQPAPAAPAAATTGSAAGAAAPVMQLDAGPRPQAPNVPEYALNQEGDPELAAARQRVDKYHGELEKGTGYAMDVMQGSMQAQIDADVERARESAAAQGMPFDEAAFRRDAQQKVQSGLATEKLGRERLRGEMLGSLQNVTEASSRNKMEKQRLELERQVTPVSQRLQRYGTEAGIYGTDVGAATNVYSTNKQTEIAAMNALNQFLSSAFNLSF